MYRIGIVGHRFEDLEDIEMSTRVIKRTIDLLEHQYGKEMIVNLGGDRGAELLAGDYCLERNIRYHLFLPQKPANFADESWYDRQRDSLNKQFANAFSITICSSSLLKDMLTEKERDKLLVDDSNFIVSFWVGKKIGRTYDIMKYALAQNKIVLSGLAELRLLTNRDLKK